jgi:hypothetical protein
MKWNSWLLSCVYHLSFLGCREIMANNNQQTDIQKQYKIIDEMSFSGVKQFLENHPDKPDDLDTIGNDPGACWVGACYILSCTGQKYCVDGHKPPVYTKKITVDDLAKMTGWVHLYADCEQEMHYFSLFIEPDKNKATLIHVYETLKKKSIVFADWLQLLRDKKWVELFSIPRKYKLKNVMMSIELSTL